METPKRLETSANDRGPAFASRGLALCFALVVTTCSLVMSCIAAFAAPRVGTTTRIDGTDLSIAVPEHWEVRQREMSVEELRAFVEELPSIAALMGLRAGSTDDELLSLWERGMKDVVKMAFDPRDGDTVMIFLYTGSFFPHLTAWRAQSRSIARAWPGKLLAVDERTVGPYTAYTSVVRTKDYGLLVGTAAVEQPEGRFVIVSTTMDRKDRKLNDEILASVKAA